MIQIDMQMPKNCIDCPACNEYLMCAIPCDGRGWGENDVKDFNQSRPEWCPLKEVVQCKHCKAWKQYDGCPNLGECEMYPEYNKLGDWFCNFGERKGT
jgi:hypothetical protein